ncbi:MAG: phospholipase D-like domain-containing protein [Longimicrobiales bacterium]
MPIWADLLIGATLLFFAAIGLLFLTRGNPISRIRLLGDEAGAPDASDDDFRRVIEAHLNTTMLNENALEVLTNGAVYPRLFEDLSRAERLITWHVFWFKPGRLAERLREVLEERARAGVKVLLIRDAFGSWARGWDGYWDSLEAAGVEIATFRPLRWNTIYKVQQRSHTRTVVIDGRLGYTGGFSICDEWLGDGRHPDQWRDTSVRIDGPSAAQLQSAFAADWAEARGELIVGDDAFPPDVFDRRDSGGYAGLIYSAPSVGSTDAERYFALSITAAKRRLYITNPYFVPDDDFRRLLAAAVERGVDVRVLTPGRNTDKKAVLYAGRAHFEAMLSAGIRIYEYDPTMVHAKTLVADGVWSSIGTINFDNRSMSLNDEVALVIHDGEVGAVLERLFLDDIEYATELELETFTQRSAPSRVLERLCMIFVRFL